MPTPIFNLRLSDATRKSLVDTAKVYGAPNPGAFAREILETVLSGDPARMQAFNRRLIAGMGEQLALKLNEPLAALERAQAEERERRQVPKKRGRRARPKK